MSLSFYKILDIIQFYLGTACGKVHHTKTPVGHSLQFTNSLLQRESRVLVWNNYPNHIVTL